MLTYSGKWRYLKSDGKAIQEGPCRISFDDEQFVVTPTSGPPLAFDLGDVDVFVPGDYELTLTLYTGNKLLLNQFGAAFQNLRHDLIEAYRKRLVRCLLLEDLEEITRFDGFARLESPSGSSASPAEFRLYGSNLAVLPTSAAAWQWRLANLESVRFDEAAWATVMKSEGERLTVTKLAKRTEEFRQRVQGASERVQERGARVVRDLFPFLAPDDFQQAATAMREGRAVPVAALKAIDARTEPALVANAVDARLKPYFEALVKNLAPGQLYAGFKMIRPDEDEDTTGQISIAESTYPTGALDQSVEETSEDEANDKPPVKQQEEPILYWFFFPLVKVPDRRVPANLVAWESTSASGRATYLFRPVPPEQAAQLQDPRRSPTVVAEAVRQLNRAIVLLNFRREPIYLPDESLDLQPRFHRYVIARRKIAELQRVRDSFVGRVIHTSPEEWQKQLEGYLAQA